mmetsp:Transcript_63411/g.143031  ORF Transcript_63411/g.143031 Transcript_63411/m.143031 type:complete len:355 (+) Transcript_63411:775-1839(+)
MVPDGGVLASWAAADGPRGGRLLEHRARLHRRVRRAQKPRRPRHHTAAVHFLGDSPLFFRRAGRDPLHRRRLEAHDGLCLGPGVCPRALCRVFAPGVPALATWARRARRDRQSPGGAREAPRRIQNSKASWRRRHQSGRGGRGGRGRAASGGVGARVCRPGGGACEGRGCGGCRRGRGRRQGPKQREDGVRGDFDRAQAPAAGPGVHGPADVSAVCGDQRHRVLHAADPQAGRGAAPLPAIRARGQRGVPGSDDLGLLAQDPGHLLGHAAHGRPGPPETAQDLHPGARRLPFYFIRGVHGPHLAPAGGRPRRLCGAGPRRLCGLGARRPRAPLHLPVRDVLPVEFGPNPHHFEL